MTTRSDWLFPLSGHSQPTMLISRMDSPQKITAISPAISPASAMNFTIQYFKIVLIAEANRMIPATTNAAPASKLKPELESFIESHTKMPRVMAPAEINNSRACARTIRTRGGCNGIDVFMDHYVRRTFWLYNALSSITNDLVQP
jgi:hypothetical protein